MRFWDGLDGGVITLVGVTAEDFRRGREIAEEWADQAFSIVDCTSFALIERLDIRRAFAFDQHFRIVRFGGGRGLVEDDEARRVHEALPHPPPPALAGAVGAVLFGRSQGFFLCLRPIRRSVLWIVESPARSPQRRCRAVCISASVRSGVASTSARRSASCGSSTGRGCPP